MAACSSSPPLKVEQRADGVSINVQTLGEYRTSIIRIRVTDAASGRVIWEITRKAGQPQLHDIILSPGRNSAHITDVPSGEFETVFPRDSSAFDLERNRAYTIELWSPSGSSTKASFTLR